MRLQKYFSWTKKQEINQIYSFQVIMYFEYLKVCRLIKIKFELNYIQKPTSEIWRKEGNILFNDTLNTFYIRLYDMLINHSDSERGNPLPPHGLLFLITSIGSSMCIIPQTG